MTEELLVTDVMDKAEAQRFVKDHYTPEKLKEKQKRNAELASIIALKYWLNTQKKTRAVDSVTSNWKRRQL